MKTTRLILVALAIFLTVILVSCEDYDPMKDPKNYKCSAEQLQQVQAEVKACKSADRYASTCFIEAKISQCDYTRNIHTGDVDPNAVDIEDYLQEARQFKIEMELKASQAVEDYKKSLSEQNTGYKWED